MQIKDCCIAYVVMNRNYRIKDETVLNVLWYRLKGLAAAADEMPCYCTEVKDYYEAFKASACRLFDYLTGENLKDADSYSEMTFTYDGMVKCADVFQDVFTEILAELRDSYSKHSAQDARRCYGLLRHCMDFRKSLRNLESSVRKYLLCGYRLMNLKNINSLAWVPGRWVAAGSAEPNLLANGAAYDKWPVLSASLLNLADPHWYLKDRRNILFVYDIVESKNILGMSLGDGNTFAERIFAGGSKIYMPDCSELAVQLLIDDGLDDSVLKTYDYSTFAPAHSFKVMCEKYKQYKDAGDTTSVRNEILFRTNELPVGIIVTSDRVGEEVWKRTVLFSQYYGIPVFMLYDGHLRRMTATCSVTDISEFWI